MNHWILLTRKIACPLLAFSLGIWTAVIQVGSVVGGGLSGAGRALTGWSIGFWTFVFFLGLSLIRLLHGKNPRWLLLTPALVPVTISHFLAQSDGDLGKFPWALVLIMLVALGVGAIAAADHLATNPRVAAFTGVGGLLAGVLGCVAGIGVAPLVVPSLVHSELWGVFILGPLSSLLGAWMGFALGHGRAKSIVPDGPT